MKTKALALIASAFMASPLDSALAAHGQHGPAQDHLIGTGAFGNIELLGKLAVTDKPGIVADVAVSPDGKWAFLAHWGKTDCNTPSEPERGGITRPDAGAWVVDISNLGAPTLAGFIPSHQDTRPGEGMQVVRLSTKWFTGDMLVMNNEQCGKNGKGGLSLWNVTNPRKPVKLSEHFGDRPTGARDSNDIHSAFAWQAGDKAYAVIVDNFETNDVDILDITNPSRPRLIRELNLDTMFPGITQTQLGLVQVFLHDVVVKKIGDNWIMLLSYWDGGFVQLNVNDPKNPTLIGDTDFNNPDPELLESAGISLVPEGNAHQAEFTANNQFFIGTDEDFSPYGATNFNIATGPNAGTYASAPVSGAAPIAILPDKLLNGPVVYGGYGCPASAPIPTPASIPGYLGSLVAGEEKIVVLQRGPTGDPSAPQAACFPGEKAHQARLAGWDAVVFVNRHGVPDVVPFCGSGGFTDEIVGVCATHIAYHRLFGQVPTFTYPDGPAIGTVGERVSVAAAFDGWGYVHLFSNTPTTQGKFAELDTFAIPEAHNEAYATGYGDLTVHEVATDPTRPNRAYLSYYSGGLRALEIQGTELVEIGGYLDPNGNNFWGVEAFVRNSETIILASDRDSGLWIFRAK